MLPWMSHSASRFEVKQVIDGDTIRIRDSNAEFLVRLVAIDAPERTPDSYGKKQPYSDQAAKQLATLIMGREVVVKYYGQNAQGVVFGEVFVDGSNINLRMVRDGFAEVYLTANTFPVKLKKYREAETQAKHERRGIWKLGNRYVRPKEWRNRARVHAD